MNICKAIFRYVGEQIKQKVPSKRNTNTITGLKGFKMTGQSDKLPGYKACLCHAIYNNTVIFHFFKKRNNLRIRCH